MSGVELRLSVNGFNAVDRMLAKTERLNLDPLRHGIAAEVEDQTRRRISEEKTAPDGTPWAELSPDYALRKVKVSGGGLLELEGNLLDSIHSELSGDVIEVGTNLVYAAVHQYGWPDKNIPQREFVGLSPDNESELEHLLDDWIMGVMDL